MATTSQLVETKGAAAKSEVQNKCQLTLNEIEITKLAINNFSNARIDARQLRKLDAALNATPKPDVNKILNTFIDEYMSWLHGYSIVAVAVCAGNFQVLESFAKLKGEQAVNWQYSVLHGPEYGHDLASIAVSHYIPDGKPLNENNYGKTLEILAAHIPELNDPPKEMGSNIIPLYLAVSLDYENIVEFFLNKYQSAVNIERAINGKHLPLVLSALYVGSVKVIELLMGEKYKKFTLESLRVKKELYSCAKYTAILDRLIATSLAKYKNCLLELRNLIKEINSSQTEVKIASEVKICAAPAIQFTNVTSPIKTINEFLGALWKEASSEILISYWQKYGHDAISDDIFYKNYNIFCFLAKFNRVDCLKFFVNQIKITEFNKEIIGCWTTSGTTPLTIAISSGNIDFAAIILNEYNKLSADEFDKVLLGCHNSCDGKNLSLVMYAVSQQQLNSIKYLLENYYVAILKSVSAYRVENDYYYYKYRLSINELLVKCNADDAIFLYVLFSRSNFLNYHKKWKLSEFDYSYKCILKQEVPTHFNSSEVSITNAVATKPTSRISTISNAKALLSLCEYKTFDVLDDYGNLDYVKDDLLKELQAFLEQKPDVNKTLYMDKNFFNGYNSVAVAVINCDHKILKKLNKKTKVVWTYVPPCGRLIGQSFAVMAINCFIPDKVSGEQLLVAKLKFLMNQDAQIAHPPEEGNAIIQPLYCAVIRDYSDAVQLFLETYAENLNSPHEVKKAIHCRKNQWPLILLALHNRSVKTIKLLMGDKYKQITLSSLNANSLQGKYLGLAEWNEILNNLRNSAAAEFSGCLQELQAHLASIKVPYIESKTESATTSISISTTAAAVQSANALPDINNYSYRQCNEDIKLNCHLDQVVSFLRNNPLLNRRQLLITAIQHDNLESLDLILEDNSKESYDILCSVLNGKNKLSDFYLISHIIKERKLPLIKLFMEKYHDFTINSLTAMIDKFNLTDCKEILLLKEIVNALLTESSAEYHVPLTELLIQLHIIDEQGHSVKNASHRRTSHPDLGDYRKLMPEPLEDDEAEDDEENDDVSVSVATPERCEFKVFVPQTSDLIENLRPKVAGTCKMIEGNNDKEFPLLKMFKERLCAIEQQLAALKSDSNKQDVVNLETLHKSLYDEVSQVCEKGKLVKDLKQQINKLNNMLMANNDTRVPLRKKFMARLLKLKPDIEALSNKVSLDKIKKQEGEFHKLCVDIEKCKNEKLKQDQSKHNNSGKKLKNKHHDSSETNAMPKPNPNLSTTQPAFFSGRSSAVSTSRSVSSLVAASCSVLTTSSFIATGFSTSGHTTLSFTTTDNSSASNCCEVKRFE